MKKNYHYESTEIGYDRLAEVLAREAKALPALLRKGYRLITLEVSVIEQDGEYKVKLLTKYEYE